MIYNVSKTGNFLSAAGAFYRTYSGAQMHSYIALYLACCYVRALPVSLYSSRVTSAIFTPA